jgi:hypothetical protein
MMHFRTSRLDRGRVEAFDCCISKFSITVKHIFGLDMIYHCCQVLQGPLGKTSQKHEAGEKIRPQIVVV